MSKDQNWVNPGPWPLVPEKQEKPGERPGASGDVILLSSKETDFLYAIGQYP